MAERMTRMERIHGVKKGESIERLPTMPREERRRIGQKTLEALGFLRSRNERERGLESMVADCGVMMLNKGELIGNPNREIEDRSYMFEQKGLFAVFDGAGGERGGAQASEAAVKRLSELAYQYTPQTRDEMAGLMMELNRAVMETPGAGMTTAVIGQVLTDKNGKKNLLYASVGDSRIYQTRRGGIRQLTQDEGFGNRIYNCLGTKDSYVKQVGIADLEKGDSLLFCSDGITGDFEKDFIPDRELGHLISDPPTARQAAEALVRRATKKDDRTAVVVRI